jgi:hypothetical protein
MNYDNLGDETLWVDVIVVCPFVHNFILHGLLSGFRRPSQQRNYPNKAQQLAHFWCTTPVESGQNPLVKKDCAVIPIIIAAEVEK